MTKAELLVAFLTTLFCGVCVTAAMGATGGLRFEKPGFPGAQLPWAGAVQED